MARKRNSVFDAYSGAGLSLKDQLSRFIVDSFTGQVQTDPEQARIDKLRAKCRDGNPFPLIAAHWPELVISDPAEARYFDGEIGDSDNPCLRLDSWQRQDVILPIFDDRISEVAIKGNTKAGKGASVSISINLWFDIYPEAKIILTSQRFEHAVDVIFGEVAMWRAKMLHPGPGRLTTQALTDTAQHYLTIANPKSGEGFSGQHGPRTLFIFDEATSVPDSFYYDAQKQARKIVALANPRTMSGWFRSLYKPCAEPNKTQVVNGPFGRRKCVTVDGAECLNVRQRRLEKPLGPPGGITIQDRTFGHNEEIPPEYFAEVKVLIPNQCDYGRFMGICQHPDPRHIAVFARGQFPTEDPELQVILGSWLDRHQAAWTAIYGPGGTGQGIKVDCFGLDVARSKDGDQTVLSAGGKHGLAAQYSWHYADTTKTAQEVIILARHRHGIDLTRGQNPVCVDMDGLGAGVGDQLRLMGVWVIEFRGNSTSQVDPRTYANLRCEAYATLGRRLNPEDRWMNETWALPTDPELAEELCAPEKVFSGDAIRFKLTPKILKPGEEGLSVKQKIGRSPDKGDSCVYLYHAVREYHGLNALYLQYTGDLTVWPPQSSVEIGPEQVASEKAELAPEAQELLAWLEDSQLVNAANPPDEGGIQVLRKAPIIRISG